MTVRILRAKQTFGLTGRLPLSKSKFYDDIVLHDEADPYIPGTQIPRVRPVKLVGNASGFVEGEIDRVAEALVALRDATPLPVRNSIPVKPARPPRARSAR
jgi:predicted DNA-binding transcriptional regulator AlpA